MRILAIRGKNLASLRGEFEIALNKPPLDQAGLFAITGHTGSGKSTLLDAMCLALFDKIPRLIGSANVKVGRSDEDEKQRVSSSDVGSIISRGTAAAYAQVDFIGLDKRSYQAHWEIKRARNKVSGRLQKQSVTLKDLETDETIGQNKSDTLDAISERIGLTFEQFRRSVLLAQGDFAAFLKARSDERSALLERITGTEIYTKLSMAAFRQFQEEEQNLHRIQDKMSFDIPLDNNKRQDLQINIAELSDEQKEMGENIEKNKSLLQWYRNKEQLEKDQQATIDALNELNIEKNTKQSLLKELERVISVQPLRTAMQTLDALREQGSELKKQLNSLGYENDIEKDKYEKLNVSVKKTQQQLTDTEVQYQKIKPEILQARELDTQIKLISKERSEQEKKVTELNTALQQLNKKRINSDELITEQQNLEQAIAQLNKELNELKQQSQKKSLEALNQEKEKSENELQKLTTAWDIHHSYVEKNTYLAACQTEQETQCKHIEDLLGSVKAKEDEQRLSATGLDEARRALTLMQESVTQGAQSIRALLNKEQECPVCGSLEHPWADQDSMLNQQYQQQKDRVVQLEKTAQSNLIELNNIQQQIKQAQAETTRQMQQIKILKSELVRLENQWRQAVAETEFSVPVNDTEIEQRLQPEMDRLHSTLEVCKVQEKQAIALQKKIDRRQKNKDQLQKKEKELTLMITEQRLLNNEINHLRHQFDSHKNELQQRKNQQQTLQQKRKNLFSEGDSKLLSILLPDRVSELDVNTIETSVVDAISSLSSQYKSEKEALEYTQQKQIKITEQCLYLQKQIDVLYKQQQKDELKLTQELQARALNRQQLKTLLDKDEAWIKAQQKDFSTLSHHIIRAETLLTERNSKLQQHERELQTFGSLQTERSKEDLRKELNKLTQVLHNVQTTRQEKLLELKQDDAKKQRIAHYREELDKQQQRWTLWGALNELIGSATGNKFRVFAQSLTLESLLAHANEHLNDFARRYQLQRVPGTDLDLQVVDRDMADEVRSVQSLSGGESFLVSLALALGLASLSSSRTQVESLFIDEGFGTLDQETLDIAIASLDTLQGLGRKVGIISHVPILVERIGTRVLVEKMGGGQSRVIVET